MLQFYFPAFHASYPTDCLLGSELFQNEADLQLNPVPETPGLLLTCWSGCLFCLDSALVCLHLRCLKPRKSNKINSSVVQRKHAVGVIWVSLTIILISAGNWIWLSDSNREIISWLLEIFQWKTQLNWAKWLKPDKQMPTVLLDFLAEDVRLMLLLCFWAFCG